MPRTGQFLDFSAQSVFFSLYCFAHAKILLTQYHDNSAHPAITLPIILICSGCFIDNIRHVTGVFINSVKFSSMLGEIAFFFHLVVLPVIMISINSIFQEKIPYPSRMLDICVYIGVFGLVVHGLLYYTSNVYGKMSLDPGTFPDRILHINAHTADSRLEFLLAVFVMTAQLVAFGVVWWIIKGESWMLLLQLLCLFCQGLIPPLSKKKWMTVLMNPFEVIVMYSLILIQRV